MIERQRPILLLFFSWSAPFQDFLHLSLVVVVVVLTCPLLTCFILFYPWGFSPVFSTEKSKSKPHTLFIWSIRSYRHQVLHPLAKCYDVAPSMTCYVEIYLDKFIPKRKKKQKEKKKNSSRISRKSKKTHHGIRETSGDVDVDED